MRIENYHQFYLLLLNQHQKGQFALMIQIGKKYQIYNFGEELKKDVKIIMEVLQKENVLIKMTKMEKQLGLNNRSNLTAGEENQNFV